MIEPPLAALDHPGDRQPHQAQGRLDVDLDHLVEHLVGDVERRPLPHVGGAVVHQDVDRAELRLGLLHQGLDLVGLAEMAGDRDDLAGQAGELGGRGLEVLFLAAGDHDGRAGVGEPAGDRLADAAAAAGHQGDFSRQIDGSAHVRAFCSIFSE